MNPDRLVMGVVLPFGVANSKDSDIYYAPQLRHFLWLYDMADAPAPIVFGHPKEKTRLVGHDYLGWWHTFAVVDGFDGRPPCLVGLGEFSGSSAGLAMLSNVGEAPDAYGLSPEMDIRDPAVLVTGVGIVFTRSELHKGRPALPGTDILAVGPGVLDEWARITGGPMPPLPSRPMVTYARWVPTERGTLAQVEYQEPASFVPFPQL